MKKALLLQPFGLDKKTEVVYRALLGLADAPASQVARRAGIKRTSAYHILESLIAIGLASSYQERGVRRFAAEHPSKLKTLFERQTILAERIIPELEKEITKRTSPSSVRAFEGKEAIRSMTEEALRTKEKTILSIGSSKKLLEFLGGKYGFGKRRRARGIFQRTLRFAEDMPSESPSRLHDTRFLPDSFRFPGYLFIFDNSVGFISFSNPPKGTLMHDADYAAAMKTLFETLWRNTGR